MGESNQHLLRAAARIAAPVALLVIAALAPAAAQGAVLNISSPTVVEGNTGTTTVTFNITCDPCTSVNAIVDWSTQDGTATAGSDYVAKSGQIDDFGNGTAVETYPIVVTVNGDLDFEPDETFRLVITGSSVGCPSLGGPGGCPNPVVGSFGTATIQDDGDPADMGPTADAGGPYGGNEGLPIAVDGGGSTDDNGITTYEWDCTNDGSFELSSNSPANSCTYPDDGNFTVALRVTDTIGQKDTDTAAVTVANVAPTIQLAGAASVDEGSTYSLTLGAIIDPGDDTVTQWIVHWGDGGTDSYGSGGVQTHVYADGPATPTIVVDLVDEDGTHTGAGSLIITVNNVAPTVDPPAVTPEPSDEGAEVTASAAFSDPGTLDTHTCTIDWGDGTVAAGTVASDACGGTHTYADNDSYTVEVCVTDNDGDTGCADSEHVVENVPPSVDPPAVTPEPSDEGSEVTASADFTDPGTLDTHTCTIDWGEGTVAAGTVADGACSGSHTYGDNGTFNVEVCVTDSDGDTGCADSDHVVDNVAPEVALDTSTAVSFPGGDDAFLGRQGVEQFHDADASDPGSDDLTFDWDFGFLGSGVSTTYFNDTGTPSGAPDPPLSPHGTFPFSASDTASVIYADPGVYTVRVDVSDDDGGSDFDDMPKLVTGDGECAYSQGFWRHQFRDRGKPHLDTATLQTLLDLVNFASGVFSEEVAASIPAEAQVVFAPGGSFRAKAVRQALAAWLNWASGGVAWDEGIDTDGDMTADTPFYAVIAMAEAILLNPDATHQELELAKDLAEAVNLRDALNPECADWIRGLPSEETP